MEAFKKEARERIANRVSPATLSLAFQRLLPGLGGQGRIENLAVHRVYTLSTHESPQGRDSLYF